LKIDLLSRGEQNGCSPFFALLIIKNKKMEEPKACECPKCQEREEKEKLSEEMNMAILLAFVPMLVITLFGQVGLF
jgi:hypothetical protein